MKWWSLKVISEFRREEVRNRLQGDGQRHCAGDVQGTLGKQSGTLSEGNQGLGWSKVT